MLFILSCEFVNLVEVFISVKVRLLVWSFVCVKFILDLKEIFGKILYLLEIFFVFYVLDIWSK